MATEPEMGVGDYTAEHVSGEIIVRARGETPSPGYSVWLAQSMIAVYPPEFVLYWEPPTGLAADVLTPFDVQASFPAEEAPDEVVVRDADGAHGVPVQKRRG